MDATPEFLADDDGWLPTLAEITIRAAEVRRLRIFDRRASRGDRCNEPATIELRRVRVEQPDNPDHD